VTNSKGFLHVTSEIGKLKAVMLHRPGKELERLTPAYLEELLFDDIPWLYQMQKEHDAFAKVMEDRGTKVYYYEKLLEEVLEEEDVAKKFIDELIEITGEDNDRINEEIRQFLGGKTAEELVEIAISGLLKSDLDAGLEKRSLGDYIQRDYPFYINPIPNLYFTRDPGAVIGDGLSISKMNTPARDRETMFLQYVYEYHPLIKKEKTPLWYDYKEKSSIEGGDVLVLSDEVVAIGVSERTSARAVEIIAQRLFDKAPVKKVLAIQIPFTRAYMHLDTVFTMVDHDKFTIYPGIEKAVKAYEITPGKQGLLVKEKASLQQALQDVLKLPSVNLIQSGGGDPITAAREQWNDSTNTLAIAPGVVVTYNRNEASNKTLRSHGIEVVEIEGSELVRGRGGPRCMSMPLVREDLK